MAVDELTKLEGRARAIFERSFFRRNDFTLLLTNESLRKEAPAGEPRGDDWWYRYCCLKMQLDPDDDEHFWTSFEFSESLTYGEQRDKTVTPRLQVSRAYRREAWSIRVRWKAPEEAMPVPGPAALILDKSKWCPPRAFSLSRPIDTHGASSAPLTVFLFTIEEIVTYLHDRIRDVGKDNQHGLVLLAGSTNASKSLIAQGLAWKFLDARREPTPHLVTFEDPIETDFWKELSVRPFPHLPLMDVDYTPRQKTADCGSLDEALKAALRQTPSVFYIGEIREDTDLARAVEFGGTGHLVMATMHAGSLAEAMVKTFKASDARGPATRAMFASKLLAVLHLEKVVVHVRFTDVPGTPADGYHIECLLPTVYRRTALGLQTLIADGPAALLPHCPSVDAADKHGSLGRKFFLKWMREADALPGEHGFTPGDKQAEALFARWAVLRSYILGQKPCPDGVSIQPSLTNTALANDLHGR